MSRVDVSGAMSVNRCEHIADQVNNGLVELKVQQD